MYNDLKTKGVWNFHKRQFHIKIIELKSTSFGLTPLVKVQYIHIKILTDSMNAVHSTRNMGLCRSPLCNAAVKDICPGLLVIVAGFQCHFLLALSMKLLIRNQENMYLQLNGRLTLPFSEFSVKKLNLSLDIDLFAE